MPWVLSLGDLCDGKTKASVGERFEAALSTLLTRGPRGGTPKVDKEDYFERVL
jgi:hypothetical protein